MCATTYSPSVHTFAMHLRHTHNAIQTWQRNKRQKLVWWFLHKRLVRIEGNEIQKQVKGWHTTRLITIYFHLHTHTPPPPLYPHPECICLLLSNCMHFRFSAVCSRNGSWKCAQTIRGRLKAEAGNVSILSGNGKAHLVDDSAMRRRIKGL